MQLDEINLTELVDEAFFDSINDNKFVKDVFLIENENGEDNEQGHIYYSNFTGQTSDLRVFTFYDNNQKKCALYRFKIERIKRVAKDGTKIILNEEVPVAEDYDAIKIMKYFAKQIGDSGLLTIARDLRIGGII